MQDKRAGCSTVRVRAWPATFTAATAAFVASSELASISTKASTAEVLFEPTNQRARLWSSRTNFVLEHFINSNKSPANNTESNKTGSILLKKENSIETRWHETRTAIECSDANATSLMRDRIPLRPLRIKSHEETKLAHSRIDCGDIHIPVHRRSHIQLPRIRLRNKTKRDARVDRGHRATQIQHIRR